MSDDVTWVDALNIDPDKLNQWSSQVPEGTPLLVWSLQNGQISSDEYFNWAMTHFQLPKLDASFFQTGFDSSILPKDRQNGPWTAWCFPVAKWEQVTYVACVEPPSEAPTGQFAYVLCDAKALAEVWNQEEAVAKKSAPADLETAPPAAAPDLPDGMNLNAVKPFKLNFEAEAVVAAPVEKVSALAEPSGESLDLPPTPDMPDPFDLPEMPTMPEMPLMAAAPEDDEPSAFAPAPKPTPAKPTAVPASSAKTPPPPAPGPTANEKQEIEVAFRQLKEHFQSSLIFKVEDRKLTIYRWSEEQNLEGLSGQVMIDLNDPSLFRIVAKTKLPYHGYVVDSALHQAFFQKLGMKQLPASVTAVPLLADGLLWGILFAIGSDTNQRTKPLHIAEKVAEKLSASLGSVWTQAA